MHKEETACNTVNGYAWPASLSTANTQAGNRADQVDDAAKQNIDVENSASVAASGVAKQDHTGRLTAETLSVMINERMSRSCVAISVSILVPSLVARQLRLAAVVFARDQTPTSERMMRSARADAASILQADVSQPSGVLRADETTGFSCQHCGTTALERRWAPSRSVRQRFANRETAVIVPTPSWTRETHYV